MSTAELMREYRVSARERARELDLVSRFGAGQMVLDVGARDGHYARLLCHGYARVVALDIEEPEIGGCANVAGDVRNLQFDDNTFDFVLCAEVLEHVPEVERAAREIIRVARDRILIGVPYRQDTRFGRVTCQSCGHIDPPWGHVNTFDERRLKTLFAGLQIESISSVGETRVRTSALAVWLMDRAGNPWGTYEQLEPCSQCGQRHGPTSRGRTFAQRVLGAIAHRMNRLQAHLSAPHAEWVHVVFRKVPGV